MTRPQTAAFYQLAISKGRVLTLRRHGGGINAWLDRRTGGKATLQQLFSCKQSHARLRENVQGTRLTLERHSEEEILAIRVEVDWREVGR